MNEKNVKVVAGVGLAALGAIGTFIFGKSKYDDAQTKKAQNIYDKEGFDSKGYNRDGYDREGYNSQGFNSNGYDRNGYDRRGYDINGYDCEGYDRRGYNLEGYSKSGYRRDGYDREGYDRKGYNERGYNREGFDVVNKNINYYNDRFNNIEKRIKKAYDQINEKEYEYALFDARKAFEEIVKNILQHKGIKTDKDDSLKNNLKLIEKNKIFDEDELSKLHAARKKCNTNTHDYDSDYGVDTTFFVVKTVEELLNLSKEILC